MVIPARQMTIEEFDSWIYLPENVDHDFEFIAGKVFSTLASHYSSKIAGEISFYIRLFLRENRLKGHITGADGGYVVAGERYIPDVGYISYERQYSTDLASMLLRVSPKSKRKGRLLSPVVYISR